MTIKIPKTIKRLAIPYMGSKREIAFSIVCFLAQENPKAKYFYDVFGGGGAISLMALRFGYDKVFYNELNQGLYNLFSFITANKMPADWWDWVSRENFKNALNKTDAKSQMIKTIWSFSNRGKTYLFSEENEALKRLCHKVIINYDGQALKELSKRFNLFLSMPKEQSEFNRRINLKNQFVKAKKLKRLDLPQLEHLEHLERLEQLVQLERLECSNLSYEQINITTPPEETIIYCDPPYRGTTEYDGGFNHKDFDIWFKNLADKGYTAYMSEYLNPAIPFKKVFGLQKQGRMCAAEHSKYKNEVIYCNR